MPNRRVEIPKGNGKVRTLQIPCIRDRVVQGAVKLIDNPQNDTTSCEQTMPCSCECLRQPLTDMRPLLGQNPHKRPRAA